MYYFLFGRLGKQRDTPIIHPGKLELLEDVMGGGFPDLVQSCISSGPRMMAMPLLDWLLWFVLFSSP